MLVAAHLNVSKYIGHANKNDNVTEATMLIITPKITASFISLALIIKNGKRDKLYKLQSYSRVCKGT